MPDVNVGIKISDAAASAGKLSKVEKGLNNIDKANKNMSISFKKAAIAAAAFAAAAAAITALGLKFLKLGSDAAETRSKYERTLGSMTASTDAFLREFNKISGLSRESSENLVADMAHIAQGFGFAEKASAEFSIEIVKLAGDLASFKNVGADKAAMAIMSAMTGEREQLKRLGIILRQVDVDQLALVQSGKTLVSQLNDQERGLASMQLITERAGIAMGDLAITADSTANVMKQISGAWATLNQEVGKFIAESPMVNAFLVQVRDLVRNMATILSGDAEQIKSMFEALGRLAANAMLAGFFGTLGLGGDAIFKNFAGKALEGMETAMFDIAALANDISNAMALAAASAERFANVDIKSWVDVPGVPGAKLPVYGPGLPGGGPGATAGDGVSSMGVQFGPVEDRAQTRPPAMGPPESADPGGIADQVTRMVEQLQRYQDALGRWGEDIEKLPPAINHAAIEAEILAGAERDAAESSERAAIANQRMAIAGINAAAALFRVAQEGGGIGGIIGAGLSIGGGIVGMINPVAGAALMAGGSVISSLSNKGEQPVRINRGQVNAIVQSNRDRKTGPDSVVVIVEQAGVEIARIEQELGRRERRDATNRIPSVPTPPHQGSLGSAYGGSTSSGTPRIGVPG